jgi:hypothetical protein
MSIRSCALFLLAAMLFAGRVVFAREGTVLYSIGNNSPWNQVSSWSLNAAGVSCGLTPQANDTVIINTAILLNTNFTLSGNGQLIVNPTGQLRGNAFDISLNDNSYLFCDGDFQIYNLSLFGNSYFHISERGKSAITNSLVNMSSGSSLVSGKLTVYGLLNCGGDNFD